MAHINFNFVPAYNRKHIVLHEMKLPKHVLCIHMLIHLGDIDSMYNTL